MNGNKNKYDVAEVFLCYVGFVGDAAKTAEHLGMELKEVEALADKEGWRLKIGRACLLSNTGKPGDLERAQNRALCWVQAHQTSKVIDKVVEMLSIGDKEELMEYCMPQGDKTPRFSCRFLADLMAAMEKCHQLKYAALGDTAGERGATESGDAMNATALHLAVLGALNGAGMDEAEKQVVEGMKALPVPAEDDSQK